MTPRVVFFGCKRPAFESSVDAERRINRLAAYFKGCPDGTEIIFYGREILTGMTPYEAARKLQDPGLWLGKGERLPHEEALEIAGFRVSEGVPKKSIDFFFAGIGGLPSPELAKFIKNTFNLMAA